jgi:mevalonate kinase
MNGSFYSHGKFLITGEYLVLKGAKVLAMPLKLGQSLEVWETKGKGFLWESYYGSDCWFRFPFSKEDILKGNGKNRKEKYLLKLLAAAQSLNPEFLKENKFYSIKTDLEFSPEWGLGSSSTLIRNVALWADVDSFVLNRLVSNGSGYDIACAGSESPLFYQLAEIRPMVQPLGFKPLFSESLYFVWLGKKQSTQDGIDDFLANKKISSSDIAKVSAWAEAIVRTTNFMDFCQILSEHNRLMENILGRESVQKTMFPDFDGTIKPLGAWGGDFVLAASQAGDKAVRNYFRTKGLEVIFSWDELVIEGN